MRDKEQSMQLGALLRELRKYHGLKLRELDGIMTMVKLSRVENGLSPLKLSDSVDLLVAYKTNITDFIEMLDKLPKNSPRSELIVRAGILVMQYFQTKDPTQHVEEETE